MRSVCPWLVLAGCAGSPPSPSLPPEPPLPATTVFLSPVQHLERASMALRGTRPSLDDVAAVAADPTQLPAIVDRYVQTPEFGATIEDLHNEVLLLRVEQAKLAFPALDALAGMDFTSINSAAFAEPLHLISDVVMNDQPYTDIVTADYTMANGTVAALWGLPHTTGFDQWERTHYSDGRGTAGILSTDVLYHRWKSTGFNYNRGRANMVSRALLCHDFLTSDIEVDTSVDLSNPDVVAQAVTQNPSCAGCHQTLDPLASYFFPYDGNVLTGKITSYPVPDFYLASRLTRWKTTNKRSPAFFGDTADGITGLGKAIAADPRFSRCAAVHFASYLTEVPADQLSGAFIARLQAEFVQSGYSAKQLAKDIVLSDEFRVAGDTDPTRAELVVGYQKARPEQLSRMIADLTGFQWTTTSAAQVKGEPVGKTDLFASDFIGFRVLAGGIDSYYVTSPVFTMNATASLASREGAAAAAELVVEHDAAAGAGGRTLFDGSVTATDEASVRARLVHLHARIFGELVDASDPSIDDSYALFSGALAASGDAKRAWKVTLVGLLSDLRAVYY